MSLILFLSILFSLSSFEGAGGRRRRECFSILAMSKLYLKMALGIQKYKERESKGDIIWASHFEMFLWNINGEDSQGKLAHDATTQTLRLAPVKELSSQDNSRWKGWRFVSHAAWTKTHFTSIKYSQISLTNIHVACDKININLVVRFLQMFLILRKR